MPIREYFAGRRPGGRHQQRGGCLSGLRRRWRSTTRKLASAWTHPTPVNRGVPVALGLVANSKNAIVGSQTTGPELVFITRALKV